MSVGGEGLQDGCPSDGHGWFRCPGFCQHYWTPGHLSCRWWECRKPLSTLWSLSLYFHLFKRRKFFWLLLTVGGEGQQDCWPVRWSLLVWISRCLQCRKPLSTFFVTWISKPAVIRMRETVVNIMITFPPFTFTFLKKENFPDCWPVRLRPCTIVMEQRRVWLFFLFNGEPSLFMFNKD